MATNATHGNYFGGKLVLLLCEIFLSNLESEMIKKIMYILLVTLAFTHTAYAQDSTRQKPDEFLTNLANNVISRLKSDRTLLNDHEKMSAYVDSEILNHFDFTYMEEEIVGDQALNNATSEDDTSLTKELRLFYGHIFSKTLAEYDRQSVLINPYNGREDADNVLITGKLIDPGDETLIFNFKLRAQQTEWKIYDIDLGGIDLIRTYQSNFKSIVHEGGVAKLVSELHKKNQLNNPIKN
jgi:phospholipid transport system substrate-binding protein